MRIHLSFKVHFLYEEEITESICESIQEVLVGANSARSYTIQVSGIRSLNAKKSVVVKVNLVGFITP